MRHEATSLTTESLITTSGPGERARKRAARGNEKDRERQRSRAAVVGTRESAEQRGGPTGRRNETESASVSKMDGGEGEKERESSENAQQIATSS